MLRDEGSFFFIQLRKQVEGAFYWKARGLMRQPLKAYLTTSKVRIL